MQERASVRGVGHGEDGASPWRARRRRVALAGLLSVAALGASAQASLATPTVSMAVANNMYPAVTDPGLVGHLASQYTFNPFTFNTTGQSGGFWHDPSGGDTTTLRGITSGNMRAQIIGPGPYTGCTPASSPPNVLCQLGPVPINAFLSADKANADAVIPTGSGTGTCTTNGTSITSCPGVSSTETSIVTGKLAIYHCAAANNGNGASPISGGVPVGAVNRSGNGVPTSPNCLGANFSLPASPTMSDVLTWLSASAGNKLSIADPNSAPFGAAAKQALVTAGFSYIDSGGAPTQDVWPAATCDSQASGVCKVRLESGISQVRGAVTAGMADLGLASLSNLKHIAWTSGVVGGVTCTSGTPCTPSDDSIWDVLNPSEYSVYGPISQYGVVTSSTSAGTPGAAAKNMLQHWGTDSTIQTTLTSYGY